MRRCLLLFAAWIVPMTAGYANSPESPAPARSIPETIWSGVVYATNEAQPSSAPKQISNFAQKLKRVFGYNQLELVSEHAEVMDDAHESWLLPGKDFCFHVDTEKDRSRGYWLKLQLYQEKQLVVQTEAKLARQSPIFFRGPLCGNGQLIIVLVVE